MPVKVVTRLVLAGSLAGGGVFLTLDTRSALATGPTPGTITTIAGTGVAGATGDNGPATSAELNHPEDVVADRSGNLYIADNANCEVRKIAVDGTINRFAGTGVCGAVTGNGGAAVNAQLGMVKAVAVDPSGNVYLSDDSNAVVRKISPAGIITNFAGNGTPGYTGDHGPATTAEMNEPWGIAIDASGDVYISDYQANAVRMVNPAGIISTVAGNGTGGGTGDSGPATSAELLCPAGLWVDPSGTLLIADEGNSKIRQVNPAGVISTVAGNGTVGSTGDGGPATSAELNAPYGVAVDSSGNVYIGDYNAAAVRMVTKSTGKISTVAGTGVQGNTGDNGPATSAELNEPSEVAIDASGNLLVNDFDANVIRKVALVNPTGQGYTLAASDGGVFTKGNAQFYGSLGNIVLNKPIVGMAMTPDGKGYWLVASDGGIFTKGDAQFYGSMGNIVLNKPIVGMAATPDGKGYWLVASDGGIFTKGDAGFFGSLGNITLNKPIVGMAPTPDGQGYWLVASDGGIFTKGDATFAGSLGNIVLNKPIVGMAATPDGQGYWLVASDGGIFTKGGAQFFGSLGNIVLNKPIVGMASTPDGQGYWLVATDGGIFTKGDAQFFGSLGNIVLNKPIVTMGAGL
jgi:sugar lactone lactonase YvrE